MGLEQPALSRATADATKKSSEVIRGMSPKCAITDINQAWRRGGSATICLALSAPEKEFEVTELKKNALDPTRQFVFQ
jgi:hypothetical protein